MSVQSLQRRSFPRSALGRGEALRLWLDVTLGGVRADAPDLTARQMAILLTIYLSPGDHTVKNLSEHLGVTKAVITRAIDSLSRIDFVRRAPDPRDKRSVLIQRTGPGSAFLASFAEDIRGAFRAQTEENSVLAA